MDQRQESEKGCQRSFILLLLALENDEGGVDWKKIHYSNTLKGVKKKEDLALVTTSWFYFKNMQYSHSRVRGIRFEGED